MSSRQTTGAFCTCSHGIKCSEGCVFPGTTIAAWMFLYTILPRSDAHRRCEFSQLQDGLCQYACSSTSCCGQSTSDSHLGLAEMGKSYFLSPSSHSRNVHRGGPGQVLLFFNHTSGKCTGMRRYSEQPVITKALSVYC